MILDTSFLVDFLRGDDKVVDLMDELQKTSINIPAPVVFELARGIHLSTKSEKKKKDVLRFLESFPSYKINKSVALLAGKIDADLRKKGKTIESEDILIAAVAIHNNETILTKNEKHFNRIPSVKITSY